MTRRRFFAVICWIGLIGHAAAAAAPQKLSVATRLDKTAMWVGDPVEYTVRVVHDPQVELILDSLEKENFNLSPFEVRGMRIRRGDWAGERRLFEIVFDLRAYETGKAELAIPSFPLYYFVRDGRSEPSEAQAETLRVPGARIALRSTLGAGPLALRESSAIAEMGSWRWLAPLVVGMGGMLFAAALGARRTWRRRRRLRTAPDRLSGQALDRWVRENLGRIRGLPGGSAEEIDRFYSELSGFLRLYLAESLQIEAAGLTADEVEATLARAGMNGAACAQMKNIFEQCEIVLYRKDGARLGAELKPRVLDALERALGGPVRRAQS